MKKQFEDFQKMKIKEACKAIEDMTYTFINPVTNQPTFVPAKHYEDILSRTVEQFLDENTKIEMLNTVYKQLMFLKQEYGKDFIKSLICMDIGIKPTDMSLVQTIALNDTYEFITELQEEQKKNFHILGQDYIDKFNEATEDKELHTQYIKGIDYQQKDRNSFENTNDLFDYKAENDTELDENLEEPDICDND